MSGWHPIESPENPVADPVTILTPEVAKWACDNIEGLPTALAMRLWTISEGRTFVAAKVSEAQAREAFVAWARAYDPRWKLQTDWTAYAAENVWLAALRHIGALASEAGGST